MPNIKRITTTYDAGYSVEVVIIDEETGYVLDHADGEFRVNPATPRVPLTENLISNGYHIDINGYFVREESRAVWPDGNKTMVVYEVGGVNPVRSGSLGKIYNDTFAESEAATSATISSGAGILFATANELISEALHELGVFAPEDSIPAANIESGLKRLNMLLDSWSVERKLIYQRTIDTLTMVAGQASYTIGSGANFDTVRPVSIEQAYITVDGIDYPLSCLLTEEEYNGIADKAISAQPNSLFYKKTYPNGTIYFDYSPDTTYTLKLFSAKPFTKFASAEDSVVYPDGYETAIMYNLAVMLAPSYGRKPSEITIAMAAQSLAAIKRDNHEPILQDYSDIPTAGRGGFDIETGDFV